MIYFFFITITKSKYILKHDWAIYIDISFREIATLLKCTKYHPRDIYLTFKWIFACIMVSNLQPTSHKVFSSMWLNLLQMMLLNVKKRRHKNFHIFSSFIELFEKVTFSNHIHLFDLQCMKKWILNKPFPEGYLHKRADKLLSIRYKILLTFSHGLQFSEKKRFRGQKEIVRYNQQ